MMSNNHNIATYEEICEDVKLKSALHALVACYGNRRKGMRIALLSRDSDVYQHWQNESVGGTHLKWGIRSLIFPELDYQTIGGIRTPGESIHPESTFSAQYILISFFLQPLSLLFLSKEDLAGFMACKIMVS